MRQGGREERVTARGKESFGRERRAEPGREKDDRQTDGRG